MVAMFQDGIESRREWFERGLTSEACRDSDIAFFKDRMSVPLQLLDILNRQ
jgi:hypothetical protein